MAKCRSAHLRTPAAAAPGEIALGDVLVDPRELLLGLFADPVSSAPPAAPGAGSRGPPPGGSRAARAWSCAGPRRRGEDLVQRVDAGGHAVGVGALEQQEARHRVGVGGRGHGAQIGVEAADGLQQDQRVAVRRRRRRRPAARHAACAGPCRRSRSARRRRGSTSPRRAASSGWRRPRSARCAP